MSESTASPSSEIDSIALRPDVPHAPAPHELPPPPATTGAPVLLAQAVLPGAGYLLLRRPGRAVATFAMFVLLVLALYWQFPKDAGQKSVAWFQFAVILVLVWLSVLYRIVRDMRLAAAEAGALAPGGAGARQLVRQQRQGLLRWLIGLDWLAIALLVFGINRLAIDSEIDFPLFFKKSNLNAARKLASGLFHPDWSVLKGTITDYAWISLEMAILGTLGGAVIAAPFSFLAARNLMGGNPVTRAIYYVMRFLFSCVRAVPTLIWGLIAVSFAIGHFPGPIALSVFTFGLLAKLYSEAIEAIDWGQIEAVTAAGANPLQVILFAAVPQVVPYFVAHTLYALEVNVHSAVVLGLVGAGGLGFVINQYIEAFAWDKTSTVLIVTIAMTLTIDYGSAYIRSKIL